ncbi:MAG: neutral/alkaline non-lysosomal ceramidase N-terminal domain-containing protein, partial [Candidatus Rokubacteria bacterium]|nr:neutral/alkaline non-lysosomal ceramidase N-terminal domain-containing protein [Candidatus Rokubacteria bacterium]
VLGRHPHAFWFRPHDGALDAPAARALVLDGGERVVWVTVDLIAVDQAFTRAVAERLGADARGARLIVSASHTHSGPGAFMEVEVMAAVSVDRFDRQVRDALVEDVAEAVRRAGRAAVPARIGSATAQTRGLTVARLDAPVDTELGVLKVVAETGAPIALVWNYAIHGTMLPPKNLHLSGDVMGLASRELEARLRVPALFVNGAVGDVSPLQHGHPAAEETARALAAAAREAWSRATPAPATVVTAVARVALPRPRLSLRNCVAAWMPRRLAIPLGVVLPREAELVAVAAGEAALVTVPGELQSQLGVAIKRAAPWKRTLIAGLSNEYLGYFVSAADYERPSYVSCASLYGAGGGESIVRQAGALLRTLRDRAEARAGDRR